MAEMEGFEPPHAFRRLADFESAPFSHLGTSPAFATGTLYQPQQEKSRLFFRHIHHKLQFFANIPVILTAMWAQATGTILDPILGISKASAAAIPKGIQRAVAKQTTELFRVRSGMARKIFAVLILNKITGHGTHLPVIIAQLPSFRKKKAARPSDRANMDKPHRHLTSNCRKSPSKSRPFQNRVSML